MYRIWVQVYRHGEHVGGMVYHTAYKRKGYAKQVAKKQFTRPASSEVQYKWTVAEENPWRR